MIAPRRAKAVDIGPDGGAVIGGLGREPVYVTAGFGVLLVYPAGFELCEPQRVFVALAGTADFAADTTYVAIQAARLSMDARPERQGDMGQAHTSRDQSAAAEGEEGTLDHPPGPADRPMPDGQARWRMVAQTCCPWAQVLQAQPAEGEVMVLSWV